VTVSLPRPSPGDLLLTGALLTLGQLTTWFQLDTPEAFAGSRWLNALILIVGTVPLLWRRHAPTAILVFSATAICLPTVVAPLDVTFLGQFVTLIVLTGTCCYYAPARRALAGVFYAEACLLAVTLTTPFLQTPSTVLFNTAVLLGVWLAARALRHREERARRLGAALAQERTQFEDQLTDAVERERAAIARDLHDIVAHGVSMMVVQVGGARMRLVDDPELASRSLLQAEDAGRQALADLRDMLGVLRVSSREIPTAANAHSRPGLHLLGAMTRQAADAGLKIHIHVSGNVDELPPTIDVSAYRIVQESITNVLKHSGATSVLVNVDVAGDLLSLTVRDGGPEHAHSASEGYGLVGIRERVAFLGGTLRFGPRASGGWEVVAEIPVSLTLNRDPVPGGLPS
jgi:signal transduction histidine kinase